MVWICQNEVDILFLICNPMALIMNHAIALSSSLRPDQELEENTVSASLFRMIRLIRLTRPLALNWYELVASVHHSLDLVFECSGQLNVGTECACHQNGADDQTTPSVIKSRIGKNRATPQPGAEDIQTKHNTYQHISHVHFL